MLTEPYSLRPRYAIAAVSSGEIPLHTGGYLRIRYPGFLREIRQGTRELRRGVGRFSRETRRTSQRRQTRVFVTLFTVSLSTSLQPVSGLNDPYASEVPLRQVVLTGWSPSTRGAQSQSVVTVSAIGQWHEVASRLGYSYCYMYDSI